jgi:VWFA-related protein
MKRMVSAALRAALAGWLFFSPPVRAQAPTFPSRVEAVTVDVVVLDKKGQPVSGLSRDDFLVSEDGVPQTIATFDAVVVPEVPPPAAAVHRTAVSTNVVPASRRGRTFILFFDDVHLTPPQAYRAKIAAATFLNTGVRPGDKVTLVASSGAAWWSATVPEGQEELLSILKRLDGRYIPDSSPDRVTEYEAMRIVVYQDVEMARVVARRFDSLGALGRQRQSGEGTRPADTYENEALQIDPLVRSRAEETYELSRSRSAITLGVMARALRSLADVAGRKSMVLVSQGFVNDTDLKEMKDVVEASRRANVPIYFLNTTGLLGTATAFGGVDFGRPIEQGDYIVTVADLTRESEGSDNLALDTGGFTVRNTNDLSAGITRITNESRSFYLLGYSPTKTTRDGKFRKIQVRLTGAHKGLEVRARRGYYAPSDDASPSAKASAKAPVGDPVIERALDSPFDVGDLPLRATAYVFDETILGRARVFVASEVDVSGFDFEEKDGRLVDAAELLVTAQHRETGEYFRYSQQVQMSLLPETRDKLKRTWYPVSRDFELPTGSYQARILVRDKRSGRIGSVAHSFEVPALAGLRISTPILSDQVEPATNGGAPKPVLLARRFFPTGILYCQYSVFDAQKEGTPPQPRVTGAYKIVRPDGSVLKRAAPTPIQPTSLGAVMRFMGINLAEAPPGEYELVLSVRDEVAGKTIEDRQAFSLVAPAAGTAAADQR